MHWWGLYDFLVVLFNLFQCNLLNSFVLPLGKQNINEEDSGWPIPRSYDGENWSSICMQGTLQVILDLDLFLSHFRCIDLFVYVRHGECLFSFLSFKFLVTALLRYNPNHQPPTSSLGIELELLDVQKFHLLIWKSA